MSNIVPEFVHVSLEPVLGTGLWMYLELNVCVQLPYKMLVCISHEEETT